jgi:hypothetical protein
MALELRLVMMLGMGRDQLTIELTPGPLKVNQLDRIGRHEENS